VRLLASLTILVFASIASADRKPKPPHGATRIAIDYEFTSFQRDERHYVIEWAKSGGYRTGSRAVDPKLVDALYASLTALRAADEPLRCISHTDDYPRFTVTVEGSEPLEVSTQSNCHGYVPWNIKRDGKQLVQFTGAVGGAVHGLLAAAEPERWKTPFEGRHAMGFERVVVSHYAPGAVTTSAAGTCALDLKKRGRPVFGEQVKVAELDLACDLGESPDCTAVTARATIVWTGVEVAVDLACPRGKVDLATNVRARFEPVKKFLDMATQLERSRAAVARLDPRQPGDRRADHRR